MLSVSTKTLEVRFQINGCKHIDQVWATSDQKNINLDIVSTNNEAGRCNFNPDGQQSIYKIKLNSINEEVTIGALVDRNFGKSVDKSDVQPE